MNSTCMPRLQTNDAESIILVFLLTLFSLCGCCVNGFTIFILFRIKKVLNNPLKFLLSLSISQVTFTVGIGTSRIINLLLYKTDKYFCRNGALLEFGNSLILICVVSKGCIAYDRYLQFALGHTYNIKMKGFFLYSLLSLPWLSTLVYVVCIIVGKYLVHYLVWVVIIIFISVIFVTSYTKLIKGLRLQSDITRTIYRAVRIAEAIRSCAKIIALEIVCCIPVMVTFICSLVFIAADKRWPFWVGNSDTVTEIGYIVYILCSCINPFLYSHPHCSIKRNLQRSFVRRNQVENNSAARKRSKISDFRNTGDLGNKVGKARQSKGLSRISETINRAVVPSIR